VLTVIVMAITKQPGPCLISWWSTFRTDYNTRTH